MIELIFLVIFSSIICFSLFCSVSSPVLALFPFIIGLSFFAVVPSGVIPLGLSLQKMVFFVSMPFILFLFVKYFYIKFPVNYYCLYSVSLYFTVLFVFESLGNVIEGGGATNLPNIFFNYLLFVLSYFLISISSKDNIITLFTKYYPIAMIALTPTIVFLHFSNISSLTFSSGNRISNGMRLGASSDGGLVNVWAISLVLLSALTFFYFNELKKIKSCFYVSEKVLLSFVFVFLFLLVALSLSRSALMLFLYVVVILMPLSLRGKLYLCFFGLFVVFMFFILGFNAPIIDVFFQRIESIFDSRDASIGGRLQRYYDTFVYLDNHPVFGLGSSFPSSFSWVTENTFLFSLVKYGFLGGINYMFLFFIFLYNGRKVLYSKRLLSVVFLLSFLDDTLYLSTASLYLAFLAAYIDQKNYQRSQSCINYGGD